MEYFLAACGYFYSVHLTAAEGRDIGEVLVSLLSIFCVHVWLLIEMDSHFSSGNVSVACSTAGLHRGFSLYSLMQVSVIACSNLDVCFSLQAFLLASNIKMKNHACFTNNVILYWDSSSKDWAFLHCCIPHSLRLIFSSSVKFSTCIQVELSWLHLPNFSHSNPKGTDPLSIFVWSNLSNTLLCLQDCFYHVSMIISEVWSNSLESISL